MSQLDFYRSDRHDNITDRGYSDTKPTVAVVVLGQHYTIHEYPNYYFIVRNDLYDTDYDPELQRALLYKDDAVCYYLLGNKEPFTMLISNELRNSRSLVALYSHMLDKIVETQFPNKPKRH